MIIIFITDIHGNLSLLPKFSNILKNSDLLIISGDITNFGDKKKATEIISTFKKYQKNILAVSGNCDYPEVEDYLENIGISLHSKYIEISGIGFAGIGGSLPSFGYTPNVRTESDFEFILEILSSKISKIPFVLVTHEPPYGTKSDTAFSVNLGSHSIRKFIENYKPLVCLTGHIHEGVGIDEIGASKIINPGPFSKGHFAKIEITTVLKSLEICSF